MAGVMGYMAEVMGYMAGVIADRVHGGSINLKACKQTFHLLHNTGMYHAANLD